MDYYWLTLAMAQPDDDLMHAMYCVTGVGSDMGRQLEIKYPYRQRWFEHDRLLRLIPDDVPERIAVEIRTGDDVREVLLKKSPEHAAPAVYCIDNVGGVTMNINFEKKTITMVHNVNTSASIITLQLDYRKGEEHDIGYS